MHPPPKELKNKYQAMAAMLGHSGHVTHVTSSDTPRDAHVVRRARLVLLVGLPPEKAQLGVRLVRSLVHLSALKGQVLQSTGGQKERERER